MVTVGILPELSLTLLGSQRLLDILCHSGDLGDVEDLGLCLRHSKQAKIWQILFVCLSEARLVRN